MNSSKEDFFKIQKNILGHYTHDVRAFLFRLLSSIEKLDEETKKLEANKTIEERINKILSLIEKLQNLHDFISDVIPIYEEEQKVEYFSIHKELNKLILFYKPDDNYFKIKLIAIGTAEFYMYGVKNYFAFAIYNIIKHLYFNLKQDGNTEITINVVLMNENFVLEIYNNDNVRSIPKQDADKFFEKGFTLHPRTSGFDLYLVKNIVENEFNGQIELEINPNEDAKFIISIPENQQLR